MTATRQRRPATETVEEGRVEVRVWDLPVRIVHWTLVATVLILSVTGFYIADPFLTVGRDPKFLMGTVRAVHIAAGWAFIAAVVARIAWAFLGNRWARWDQFVPVGKERRALIRTTLAFYLFRRRETPPVVGHNPLAGLTYLVLFAMFGVQIVTGVALAQLPQRTGLLWGLTGWVFSVAPIPMVRLVHHLIMWLTLGFVVHHVYSAVLTDVQERSGLVSSIITGWKRVPRSHLRPSDVPSEPQARP